jgi:hypothetical protein
VTGRIIQINQHQPSQMSNTLMNAPLALRGWCLFLALFEGPNIKRVLSGAPLAGFQSRLQDSQPTRRLWASFLSFLSFSRLLYVVAPTSRSVLYHNAAVHIVEALFLVPESKLFQSGGQGGKVNALVIIANALVFLVDAFRRKNRVCRRLTVN